MDYKILKAQLSTMSQDRKCNGFSLLMFEELNGGISSIEQAEQIVNKYRELTDEQQENLILREEKLREEAYRENIGKASQNKNRSAKTSRKVNKKQTTQKKPVIFEVKEQSPINQNEGMNQQPIAQQQQDENQNQENIQNNQTPVLTYDMYSISNIKQQDSESQQHDLDNDKGEDNELKQQETKLILLKDSEDALIRVDEARDVRTPQLQEILQNQGIQNQIDEQLVVQSLNQLQDEGQINTNESQLKYSRSKRLLIKDDEEIIDPHVNLTMPMVNQYIIYFSYCEIQQQQNLKKSMSKSKRKQGRQKSVNSKNQKELIDD